VPSSAGLAAIEAFWAGRLGCTTADLHRPGISVAEGPGSGAFEGVRLLGEADRSALDALRLAAGPTAWEHSAVDPDRPPVFGRFAGGALVAAATLEDAGEPVSSVGVLTHPGHRGRGHGRAVAAAATRAALDAGSVAHYQTLDANAPSVAIARALGFGRDATTLAVRPG
jgi:GNAT superfamily N-acetyltransferase